MWHRSKARHSLPRATLGQLYSGRDNGIGAIRLGLAVVVVFTHGTSLGFGWEDLGESLFRNQTNTGTLAVFGFFVLSGLLITRSAARTSLPRFVWHRMLRILPGLWVCLLVTAFVVAPLVALREWGTLHGFWSGPNGPLQYVTGNWFTGVRHYGIHDLLGASTPWGRQAGGSVFDGALWSLVYEVICYALAGTLAVTACCAAAGGWSCASWRCCTASSSSTRSRAARSSARRPRTTARCTCRCSAPCRRSGSCTWDCCSWAGPCWSCTATASSSTTASASRAWRPLPGRCCSVASS
ncbi:acyltransferase family protein [Dactylosporangium cerinum]